tara:strand:+ start:89 stop:790 length:702 start_codon:yes stop_codon:yes gene_type:complete
MGYSQARSRAMMMQAEMLAKKELMEEYEDVIDENQDMEYWSGWGRMLGSIGLPLIGTMIGGPLGTLAGASLLAGLGSKLGSDAGEAYGAEGSVRVGDREIESVGLLGDVKDEMNQNIEDAYGDFEQRQWTNALTDTMSAFIIGGGTELAKEAFATDFMKPGTVIPDKGFKATSAATYGSGGVNPTMYPTTMTAKPTIWNRLGHILLSDYQFNPAMLATQLATGTTSQVAKGKP